MPIERAEQGDLRLTSHEAAVRELASVRAAGGGCVVDMGCWDFEGHSTDELRRISVAARLSVVAATGCRTGATGAAHLEGRALEDLVERLRSDLNGDGGARCGVLKCGSGTGRLSELDELLIAAVGAAQVLTGAPVLTHTEVGDLALDQVAALERAGVDLARVAIGHLDRAGSELQLAVLAAGANIVYDQIGKTKYLSLDDYQGLLEAVLDAGYEGRVMLASDFGRRTQQRAYGGEPGLDYILREFVPELIARGLPQEAFDAMLVDNPARFLAYDCGRAGCCAPGGA